MISTPLMIGLFLGILIVLVFQFLQKHLRALTSPGCLMLMALIILTGFGVFYFMTQTGLS